MKHGKRGEARSIRDAAKATLHSSILTIRGTIDGDSTSSCDLPAADAALAWTRQFALRGLGEGI
jgi:hypothetical protein